MTSASNEEYATAWLKRTTMMVERLVHVMKACDPEYCASHDWKPCEDQEWDEALAEAEDLLEELHG